MRGETSKEDVLVALVSWGEGCADPNFPAVNTRITDGIHFIHENVCKYSADPPPEFLCNGPITTAPTVAPTGAPTEAPVMVEKYSYYSLGQIGSGLVILFLAAWLLKRISAQKQGDADTLAWESPLPPLHKPWMLQKQFSSSSETEYLYQDSPSSSIGSRRLDHHVSYDSVEP